MECSKEERLAVNRLSREFKKTKSLYEKKEIGQLEYYVFLLDAIKLLDYFEWKYDDNTQDFQKWKDDFEKYQVIREKL